MVPLNLFPPPSRRGGGRCQHTLAGSFYKRHAVRQVLTPEDVSDRIPPTACQCRGSEALSSPSRGAFHLSLTVLVHYRWPGVSAPWRVVPPASHRVSRAPWYSGSSPRMPVAACSLRDSHPLRWAFPDPSRTHNPHPVTSSENEIQRCPTTPAPTASYSREPGLGAGPVRSPLLRASPPSGVPTNWAASSLARASC